MFTVQFNKSRPEGCRGEAVDDSRVDRAVVLGPGGDGEAVAGDEAGAQDQRQPVPGMERVIKVAREEINQTPECNVLQLSDDEPPASLVDGGKPAEGWWLDRTWKSCSSF